MSKDYRKNPDNEIEFVSKIEENGSETRKFDAVDQHSGNDNDETRKFTVPSGKEPQEKCEERSAVKSYTTLSMLWKILRPFIIFLVSAGLIVYIGVTVYKHIEKTYFAPVNTEAPVTKDIEIERGSSLSTIATKLLEEGIIRNKLVFQLYVDLNDMGSKLLAGKYELSTDMTMDQIIDILGAGDGGRQVVKVTFTEGMTIEDMALVLEKNGVFDEDEKKEFLDLCNNAQAFSDYDFVQAVAASNDARNRKYLLEGYMFPDTYEFYVDETPENIIKRLLNRFDAIFALSYEDRAKELDMSIDQIITLASIIEWEALPQDYSKVSSVFYNRINDEMTLDSCATMRYVTGEKKFVYSNLELEIDDPYNTYMYKGLPIGPIANPGQKAIEAALFPDQEYLDEGFLYFCNKEAGTGELAFAKTLDEHNANVEMYKEFWE